MNDFMSVVQFSCFLLEKECAPVLKHILDNSIKIHGIAGSAYTVELQEGEENTYLFVYQAYVPVLSLAEILAELDLVRSESEDYLTEDLYAVVSFGKSVVKVVPNQNMVAETKFEEQKQINEFLVYKNNLITNEVVDLGFGLEYATGRVFELEQTIENLTQEINGLKTYHYNLVQLSDIMDIVGNLCSATDNEDLLEEYTKTYKIQ